MLELLCSLDGLGLSVCSALEEEESKANCSFALPLSHTLELQSLPASPQYSQRIEGPLAPL